MSAFVPKRTLKRDRCGSTRDQTQCGLGGSLSQAPHNRVKWEFNGKHFDDMGSRPQSRVGPSAISSLNRLLDSLDQLKVADRMDSDARYYWRRVCEEVAAASRAVTPAGRDRHEQLVRVFVGRLKDLNAPCPFTDEELARMLGTSVNALADAPAFRWPAKPKQTHHV